MIGVEGGQREGSRVPVVSIAIALLLFPPYAQSTYPAYFAVASSGTACIIQCAKDHPNLGLAYDNCVKACPASRFALFLALPMGFVETDRDRVATSWDREMLQDAIIGPKEVQQLLEASNDPLKVLSSAREFLAFDWDSQLVRERFVGPFSLAVVQELVRSHDDDAPNFPEFLDGVLARSQDELMTRATRTSLLVILKFHAIDEEEAVDAVIEDFDLLGDVEPLLAAYSEFVTGVPEPRLDPSVKGTEWGGSGRSAPVRIGGKE